MNKIKIPTSFNIELDFEQANVGQRFLAWLLDLMVQLSYLVLAFRLLGLFLLNFKNNNTDASDAYNLTALQMLITIPVLLYHLVSEVYMNGQSIGKKLLGIKVISESGNRPSFYQYLLRWLLRPFDVTSLGLGVLILLLSGDANDGFVILFYLVVVIVAVTVMFKKNKRLGDLSAGTLVIASRVKSDLNDTIFFDLEENYEPRYQNVLLLSDRDMNIIKTILDSSIRHNNHDLAERTSAKIRTALKISDYQHPFAFLETVLKDYNYLSGSGEGIKFATIREKL